MASSVVHASTSRQTSIRPFAWAQTKLYSWSESVLLRILRAGPIPRHVSFEMDGNRRYARRNHKDIPEGHGDGFLALRRMLEVCLRLGITCVTAYAFSIENFKRPEYEVEALMRLAEEKLIELSQHGYLGSELLDEYGVRLNVIGNVDLLPESVQAAAKKAEEMTRHNDKAILNLCMPYTSRDEMATAINSAVRSFLPKEKSNTFTTTATITEKELDAHLMTSRAGSPPLDIFIRTSGVCRLSDFLLWQACEDTQLQFAPTYWPDFSLWDFFPMILDYQRKVWNW